MKNFQFMYFEAKAAFEFLESELNRLALEADSVQLSDSQKYEALLKGVKELAKEKFPFNF